MRLVRGGRITHEWLLPPRLRWGITAALAGMALLAGGGVLLTSGGGPAHPSAHHPTSVPPTRHASAAARTLASAAVPARSEVATMLRAAPRFASPGGAVSGTVPATWYGRRSVLPVIAAQPGWVQVRLPQRPNGSTAWVPGNDVRLSSTPYRIVISLASTRLLLYQGGHLVMTAPAGVGAVSDPTPAGQFFVAFDEQPPQPNPGYGPFIMVTSAHSPTIADWDGSGDAVIGIHGPLGEDSAIGTRGARISHGCVRLHDQDLRRLAAVPPGTPITIQ